MTGGGARGVSFKFSATPLGRYEYLLTRPPKSPNRIIHRRNLFVGIFGMEGDFVLNISAPAAAPVARTSRPPLSQQKKRPREQRSETQPQRSHAHGDNAAEQKPKVVRPAKKQQSGAAAEDGAPAKFVKRPAIVGIKGPKALAAGKPGKDKPADAKGVQAMGAKHRPMPPAERPPIRIPTSAQKRPLSAASGNGDSDSEQESSEIVIAKQRQPPKKVKKDAGSPPAASRREVAPAEDEEAGTVDDAAEVTPSKPSRKRPVASDTRMHHMKPSALSKDALAQPKAARESRHLFTESSFESLGLCEKLVSLLTKPNEEVKQLLCWHFFSERGTRREFTVTWCGYHRAGSAFSQRRRSSPWPFRYCCGTRRR